MIDMKKALQNIDDVIEKGPYKDTWASLSSWQTPKWYQKAKFGIFIHWGVYSVPAFDSEWYPRNMYIEGSKVYEHHIKTYGAHKDFGYKDFIPMFKAEKFDPNAWAALFKKAGAKYVVPVAEHHDGFQMYRSNISHWNAYEMGPKRDIVGELKAAVEHGKISEADVNARLDELLELVLTTHAAVEKAPRTFDAEAHHALARRAAAESVVLLQNEGGLLPLKAGERVAVVGDFAQTPRYQGAGSSAVNSIKVDSVLGQLAESGLQSVGFAPGFDRQGRPDDARKAEAVALARKADTVLLFLGLDEIKESEGIDRSDMKLAVNQLDLLEAISQVNPNVVVVLSAGASLETPWLKNCRALVYGALGGQAGAGAMLDVLTGKVCPGGKLAETWANAYHETPARAHFGGEGRTVEYRESLYVGYRYHQTAGIPSAFPFGYGLSYTSFEYSDLKAGPAGVTLTVTNTGSVAGAEIVQLYVAKPDAKIFRPAQELKGFARVFLNPGESREVTIPLDDKAFRYWNVLTNHWEVEGGCYELRVGASCEDIRLRAVITVEGTVASNPYEGKDLLHYQTAEVRKITDAEFEALLGRPIPESKIKIDRNMTLGELSHGRSPLGWAASAVLGHLLRKSMENGKPDLNILFQYNMPLRALAKMTNGAVSMGMVDGIVMEAQGFWIIGLLRVAYEAIKNVILNAQLEKRLHQG